MAGISIHSIGRASSWWAPGIETGAVEGAWIWTVTDVDVWTADRARDSLQSAPAGWMQPALSTRARPHPANRLRRIEAPAPGASLHSSFSPSPVYWRSRGPVLFILPPALPAPAPSVFHSPCENVVRPFGEEPRLDLYIHFRKLTGLNMTSYRVAR